LTGGEELRGRRVLVTRPAERAHGLAERVTAAGGEPVAFPVIEIVPLTPATVPDAREFHAVLFVSPAAVAHGLPALGLDGDGSPRIGAVGPATARALEAAGVAADIRPQGSADSEGLLEHEALQAPAIAGRRVLIVRGEGGRGHLAARLVERGAAVEYAEVYRRARPARHDPAGVADCDIVTATSIEGLDNLLAIVGPVDDGRLRSRPLAVASPRIAGHARTLGFTGPVVASDRAGDEGLMAAIVECARRSDVAS